MIPYIIELIYINVILALIFITLQKVLNELKNK